MYKSLRTTSLAVIATALVASGALTSPAKAASSGDQAVVTVPKSTNLIGDGETITVTGSGFLSNGAATNGTRPPLFGTFSGVYVTFGKFQDPWKPSESAPSANRLASMSNAERTKWLVPSANVAGLGGAAGGAFELPTDGNFSVTINVSKELFDSSNNLIFNESTAGSYGIFTYAGSGARYAQFETFTPISFATEEDVVTPNPPVDEAAASGSSSPKLSKKFSREIAFTSGSSKLNSASKAKIRNKIKDFRLASKVTITATAGMTSGASTRAVNQLAQKRANAIKKYLVAQGVAADKIVIKTKVAKAGKKPSTKVVATP